MFKPFNRYMIACIAVFSAISQAVAQPKAIGTTYSLSGLSVMYEHNIGNGCFIDADLRAEMGEVFRNITEIPGISTSLSCNFIFKEWESNNGNMLCAFAGPGITAGIASDLYKDRRYFFGLKGRAGIECRFDRGVAISASLNPVIGSHLVIRNEYLEMTYYRNGLLNAVLPEIGIKYTFGR